MSWGGEKEQRRDEEGKRVGAGGEEGGGYNWNIKRINKLIKTHTHSRLSIYQQRAQKTKRGSNPFQKSCLNK